MISISTDFWSSLCVERHVIHHAQRPLGILNPSSLFAVSQGRIVAVFGPVGKVCIPPSEGPSLLEATIASGSVLLGDHESIEEVSRLLSEPRTSRTTSFLCNLAVDCRQVISAQLRIRSAKIAVLGCGGIGSLCAQLLAGAGVAEITLVDHDLVEESNLNRQLFWSRSDFGEPKVTALKRSIENRFSDIIVNAHKERITGENIYSLLSNETAAICSIDEPIGTEKIVARAAESLGVPVLAAGYLLHEGFVNRPAGSDSIPEELWVSSPGGVMPSFGPTNAELAGRVTGILLQSIAGFGEMPTRFIHSLQFDWRTRESQNPQGCLIYP
jgi:hypothetical protein